MKLYEKQKEEKDLGSKDTTDNQQKERLEKFLKSEGKLVGSLPLGAEASFKKTNEEKAATTTGTFLFL